MGLLLLLLSPKVAGAHPLGNFTVNRYSRLELGAEQINLLYIIDMAEIPAHQERTQIDTNGDKEISPAEQDAYLADQVAVLQGNLFLSLAGAPTALALQASTLEFPIGQANLPTLRLTAQFVAALPAQNREWQLDYRDINYQGRVGWSEVVVRANIGARLLESTVRDQDVSQELRTYPTDLLQSPLAINAATVRFTTQATGQAANASAAQVGDGAAIANPSTAPLRANDRFAELITLPSLGPWRFLLTALAAFGWGAFHAFSPGHGKTIVGAYLVGTRGTVRHALFLGVITTVTHTVGVFAFGLITLFASRYILPETLFPWLSLLSGLLVVW
ncbi:MAG: high-affinity nickel-transporter, partial [Chloroflexota bacterium]|nr:high-affinity nickel-transporter [Chloroflexota bacterium]